MFLWNVPPPPSALNLEAQHSSKTSVNIYQTKHYCNQKTVNLNHQVDSNPQPSTYFFSFIHTTEKVAKQKNENVNRKFLGSWVPEITLRTMWKQADNIHESCKSEMQRTASKTTQIRVIIMEKLKKMLAQ
jgi:hypothetical protein